MKLRLRSTILTLSVLTAACTTVASEAPDSADVLLRAELAPLHFFAGSCWRGEFPDGRLVDVHCIAPALGGQFVRDRHAVTGGESVYAGETLYAWNSDDQTIAYQYWNTAGGVSRGTAYLEEDRLVFPNERYQDQDGLPVLINSFWQRDGRNAFESVVVSRYADGRVDERRIRYRRMPLDTGTGYSAW